MGALFRWHCILSFLFLYLGAADCFGFSINSRFGTRLRVDFGIGNRISIKMDKNQSKFHLQQSNLSDVGITINEILQLKIGKSAKHFVALSASSVILYHTSASPLYYAITGILNSAISKILKKLIKQPRPPAAKKSGYGMPSSHSQSILFFATVLVLRVWLPELGIMTDTHSGYTFSTVSTSAVSVVAIIGSLVYCYYACSFRIQSGLHTVEQTLVGAGIGVTNGIVAWNIENHYLGAWLSSESNPMASLQFRIFMTIFGNLLLYYKDILSALGHSRSKKSQRIT